MAVTPAGSGDPRRRSSKAVGARLERPGAALALVFVVLLLAVIGVPALGNALVVDPRVTVLPEGGKSFSPTRDGAGVTYRVPGGWFFRESEFSGERQLFHSPEETALLDVRFVDAGRTAAETLLREAGSELDGVVLHDVTSERSDGADSATVVRADVQGAAFGVVQFDGSPVALVVRGSGTAAQSSAAQSPAALVDSLLAGAEPAR
ncbi:hypothetical protein NVV95_12050 [Herbiconiux sp. CPCC 205716]|uniref:DUF4245 domain-containing protein n=1 Tax=Herbiconiux gentiana TaxID=2970912 RepID=A0ABT2GK18_9MICO|nr:hypothetical protein [Herbiconiux gentiana]MCS5715279.1 hypothetical protein [Herbiconiux gentiana]